MTKVKIEELVGKTFEVLRGNNSYGGDAIIFKNASETYSMHHEQDCCERVWIEEVIGDLDCLTGYPILKAEVVTNEDEESDDYDMIIWTFYHVRTVKGSVTIRWCGKSHYYSVAVDIFKL